jgi:iron complex transport system substrate-binding protein
LPPLEPDLVLTFPYHQADIAANLIRRGIDVHALQPTNRRGDPQYNPKVGAMMDASERAEQLVGKFEGP